MITTDTSTPLRILALTHSDISEACTFARLVTPLHTLESWGKIEPTIVSLFPRRIGLFRQILRSMSQWELVWIQRPYHYIMLPMVREAHRLRIPILVDLDDWLLEPPDGQEDNVLGIRPSRETSRLIIRAAQAVTVSTSVIASRLTAAGLRAHVLPNAVDTGQFKRLSRPNYPITIAFCGSPTHIPDMSLIAPGMRVLLEKYSDPDRLRVVSVGCPISQLEGVPGYTHYAHVPATAYPALLSDLRVDIGLAPLHDTFFNRAKSDIKYLEYSATGAATIASDVAPYRDSVREDRGVLVAENTAGAWVEAVVQLAEDPQRRQRIATRAYEWVESQRSIEATAHRWYELFSRYARGASKDTSFGPGIVQFDPGRFERALANIVLRQLPNDARQVRDVADQSLRGRLHWKR